jgi:hypothetical protein
MYFPMPHRFLMNLFINLITPYIIRIKNPPLTANNIRTAKIAQTEQYPSKRQKASLIIQISL